MARRKKPQQPPPIEGYIRTQFADIIADTWTAFTQSGGLPGNAAGVIITGMIEFPRTISPPTKMASISHAFLDPNDFYMPQFAPPQWDNIFYVISKLTQMDILLQLIEGIFGIFHKAGQVSKEAEAVVKNSIDELNKVFLEHNLDIRFEAGKIIPIDSDLIHVEITKPVFAYLEGNDDFKNPRNELLTGYEHHRKGNYREAVHAASNAFESTLKVLCEKNNIPFDPNADAKKLLEACFKKGPFLSFMRDHYNSYIKIFENSVTSIRNKRGGHGFGSEDNSPTENISSFALNLAATNILFPCERK